MGAVFNGQDPKAGPPLLHRLKHVVKAVLVDDVGKAEGPVRRGLGIGPFHPLAGDAGGVGKAVFLCRRQGKGLFLRQKLDLIGPGQLQNLAVEEAGVFGHIARPLADPGQDLPLPGPVIDGLSRFLFIGRHLGGQLHPL